MAGLVGQRLGRYEIVDRLGAGGMGEVYRAHDTELGRPVAVKVISTEVAESRKAIDRFEREAKTVAQLSHPNILDIHDFGREGDTVYAVTELLEGQDLRERTRSTTLPLSKVLEIGIAVANGLSAAHNKGIVHRDIKPENVFVTSTGQVKILDFGIASLRAVPTGGVVNPDARTMSLTGTGVAIGTVGYMSPEQVRGKVVDSRSDIFALGCLLYEMLAGQRAFQLDTPQATMNAILNRDPEPISDLRSDVSPALEAIVGRCLEKQPDERFESARDVAFALQALTGARKAISNPRIDVAEKRARRWRTSVAAVGAIVILAAAVWAGFIILRQPPMLPEQIRVGVVPFKAPVSDPQLKNFGTGLALSLVDDLALVAQQEQGIDWIVPVDEAGKGLVDSAAKFGRDYGATVAVTGELARSGDRVRLTLRIEDPKSGRLFRSSVIEDIPSNVEAFQHGPVHRVTEMLGVRITPQTRERIDASATTTTVAFDLFTRGRGLLALADDLEQVEEAATLIDGIIEEDPLFPCGWVVRARCRLAFFESTGEPGWLELGLEDAARALDLGGRPEAAWRATAALHTAAGETGKAIDALEAGTRAAPNDPELRFDLAEAYQQIESLGDAQTQLQRAIYLRPDYWVGYDRLAKFHLSRGDLESAAIEFRHITTCAPDFALGYVKLAAVYMYLERPEAARVLLERSLEIEPSPWALTNLGSIHFDASRFAQAADYYRASLELQDDSHILWGNLGFAYRFGVEPDKAQDAFLRAVELAKKQRLEAPDDLELAADLAGYHAMLGNHAEGLALVDAIAADHPNNPLLMSKLAEVYGDLGERDKALEWVERSFDAGISPERFEGRPTLSNLVADKRYRALVQSHPGAL